MASTEMNKTALCPFYVGDTAQSITCEGVYGKTVKQTFKDSARKESHAQKFCSSIYKACGICRLNLEKYKEDET